MNIVLVLVIGAILGALDRIGFLCSRRAQSIAIGIDNNGIVGPDRRGPRNQRRTPMAINTVFYLNLM